MLKNLILVALGGMTGSVLRYLVSLLIKSDSFPYATLVVNIIGCFVIGLVLTITLNSKTDLQQLRLFVATGICGGFTTFSAFSAECILLLQQQKFFTALTYILISVITGLAATFAAFSIAK